MIIYFTTCNQKLYNISCKALISTFILNSSINDKLFVFHENINIEITSLNVIYINVADCLLYNLWFNKFKDHIPIKFGGNVDITKDERMMYGEAVKWNQKACLWFWKIISMQRICNHLTDETRFFIFLDADTFFKSSLDNTFYERILPNDCAIGYHMGKFRRSVNHKRCAGIESGIMVFRNNPNAFKFIDDLVEIYLSGTYLDYIRWDDGYILRMLIEKEIHKSYCHDFVLESTIKNVISEGPFKGKIIHEIGKHFRLRVGQ